MYSISCLHNYTINFNEANYKHYNSKMLHIYIFKIARENTLDVLILKFKKKHSKFGVPEFVI